jgi:hypothetical protein
MIEKILGHRCLKRQRHKILLLAYFILRFVLAVHDNEADEFDPCPASRAKRKTK